MTKFGWVIFICILLKVLGIIEASWWATLFPLWCLFPKSVLIGFVKSKGE